VLVFLPQVLILFFFILVLEESGYLPRAAFLLDRIMGGVGLSGRSFIPLLSSFACAIPGIMATRTIANPRDRLVTIMIAPLMTCSARLPVYALLIGAFIPQRLVGGPVELQGLVLFVLYLAGILGSLLVAWILKRTTARGVAPLMMELPTTTGRICATWPWACGSARRSSCARGHHHPGADHRAVVPGQLPGATGRRDAAGHRIQLRRHAGTRPVAAAGADRLQLADQHRAGAGPGGARSGGERPGHRVCAVRHRRRHGAGAVAHHRAVLEPGDGACRCWPGTCSRRSAWRRWRP
jgi:hypothetical protein